MAAALFFVGLVIENPSNGVILIPSRRSHVEEGVNLKSQ
jgi:hypothetical protein